MAKGPTRSSTGPAEIRRGGRLAVSTLATVPAMSAGGTPFASSWAIFPIALVEAATFLSRRKIGAVIAIERDVGLGGVAVGMFHLITHAFFKALLFMGAGSVIHGCHEEQNIRRMGGLRKLMPITFATYAVGMLAISSLSSRRYMSGIVPDF